MKYYILNINYNGTSEVDYWLGERGVVPIFYGVSTLSQIREDVGHNIPPQAYVDAKRFVDMFTVINKEAVVFSIGNEYVYIFKQGGPLFENTENDSKYKNQLVKYFNIDLLKKVKIKDCPLVLVSIKANRYIQSGTFRDLNDDKYLGNTKALEHVITGQSVSVENYTQYLQCLSSLEFETLVAKYLEEAGLFVPAYKGGCLKNFDLFCRNIGNKNVVVGDVVVEPKTSLSVQIKLNLNSKHKDVIDRVDMVFCISSILKDKKIYDWKFLKNGISKSIHTKQWLETNLDWLQVKDNTE